MVILWCLVDMERPRLLGVGIIREGPQSSLSPCEGMRGLRWWLCVNGA